MKHPPFVRLFFFTIAVFAAAPASAQLDRGFTVCSSIDFTGLKWGEVLNQMDKDVMILALNISGSYEGADSWGNLTNNFDQQGVSLGLLNQCLGQGSLQPMLIRMRDRHPSEMRAIFPAEDFKELESMLDIWERSPIDQNEILYRRGFSILDDDEAIRSASERPPSPNGRDDKSAQWAAKTLYLDAATLVFKPDWQAALSKMSDTIDYRSIQLTEALTLRPDTVRLFQHFKMKMVGSFLFFYDLVVQDGGINDNVVKDIDNELAKTPHANEHDRLKTILEIRLKYVKPAYVADVRARKTAIIEGQGIVHGLMRNFDKEYCTDIGTMFKPEN